MKEVKIQYISPKLALIMLFVILGGGGLMILGGVTIKGELLEWYSTSALIVGFLLILLGFFGAMYGLCTRCKSCGVPLVSQEKFCSTCYLKNAS